jgi:hypothetical protein
MHIIVYIFLEVINVYPFIHLKGQLLQFALRNEIPYQEKLTITKIND